MMKTPLLISGVLVGLLALPTLATAQGPAKKELQQERREKRKDMRDKRQDKRDNRKDKRQDKREERRDNRKDKRQDKREERRDNRKDAREEKKEDRKEAKADRKEKRDLRKARRSERVRERWAKRRAKMLVSGYAPTDKELVIRGQNFSADAVVLVGGKTVKATITPTQIRFGAAVSGQIVIKAGGQTYAVGTYDAKAVETKKARKKRRADRRKRAKERVKARWKKRAKKREDRQRAYEEELKRRQESREARARQRAKALRAAFKAAFLASEPAQAELALHAGRKARLSRMLRLAEVDDREALAIRIEVLIEREDTRHTARMAVLKRNFKG